MQGALFGSGLEFQQSRPALAHLSQAHADGETQKLGGLAESAKRNPIEAAPPQGGGENALRVGVANR